MRSVVEIGASVPAFLGKLWKLVNDSETNHLISWSPGGKTFVIKNQADFARELLPLYYKHNNMASFIRQLNMYGFHKITSVENGGLRYEKDEIEFSHPCFMRGHAYLLEHIKRKIANPKAIVASNEGGDKILLKPELMNKVLADVKQMKGKQESLDAKFSAMKQENEALWREVAILRQKHIKQQQIVNNLIQFLMSLVQPTRAPNSSGNNVGVKRPYQLMINNAAHNSGTDGAYPGRLKNIKLDKDALMEELAEDNLEDGPTIHELAHDDILHNEASQDSLDPSRYVYVSVLDSDNNQISDSRKSTDPYHVTMDDGDDIETDGTRISFPTSNTGYLRIPDTPPIITSPSPTLTTTPPVNNLSIEQAINNVTSPGTSKPKNSNSLKTAMASKSLLSPSNFHIMNPSPDFKLPAEIFASDDSVSDTGINTAEEINTDHTFTGEQMTKDKMFGGINIKVENNGKRSFKVAKKSKKSREQNACTLNLADIKTELQDDLDWNNMSLATMNNNANVNRLQAMCRRDNISQNRDEYPSHFGPNPHNNKNDIDDHLDTMQTDLESLRELLRSDTYSLDTNTLLGIEQSLFGSDDPFYGLAYNSSDERAKTSNNAMKLKSEITNVSSDEIRENNQSPITEDDAEGNQLISYTGNIPDFGDISMPDLECENSQEECLSPRPGSSMLNTPQVTLQSPSYPVRP
ncbi:heat shock factor protein isoform X2 [Pararge aegeria]|uniref:heat shock factor protein isoform X2 n=1 Tax=Pararge aegeria TaxID=116150 RepID=UPI0019D1F478|nr:heat shock factor protein isoform X2 [Pararge aegeria]